MSNLGQGLQEIYRDNRSGSLQILAQLIGLLKQKLKTPENQNVLIDDLQSHFEDLESKLGSFSVVQHFITYLKGNIAGRKDLKAAISAYEKKWENIEEKITENAFRQLVINNKKVFLHSNSGTIVALFKRTLKENTKLSIIQTESRPGLEGRKQAEYIVDLGYPVTLIIDAHIPNFLKVCDMAIVGADKVYKDRFVNKAGTRIIADYCRMFKMPFYVLADSRKFMEKGASEFRENPKPVSEVWDYPEKLDILNYYFETIPNNLVTRFITEQD